MKKTTIGLLVFMSSISVGCINKDQANINNTIEKASTDANRLLNATYEDMQSGFGAPYSSIYYINSENLRNKNINSITIDDIQDSVISNVVYKHPDYEDKFLHVYFENGTVKNALTNNYNYFESGSIVPDERLKEIDYKLEFYKGEGAIFRDTFNINSARNMFVGKSINNFDQFYKVKNSNFKATKIKDNSKIYFYSLVNFDPSATSNLNQNLNVNYQLNTKPKLAVINPINNNISYVNQISSEDLSQYSNTSLAIKTDENSNIKWIKILNKDETYDLINKSFNLKPSR